MLVKSLLIFATGLFLTYPAAVLTTFLEGQSVAAIYSYHLPTSLLSYWIIAVPTYLVLSKFTTILHINVVKVDIVLLIIVSVYAVLVFKDLRRADILNDDYDLAYQAYNLQDGIQAARKAFIISFNTHPPLFMTIKHYWFQLLFPNGLETVPNWGYRGMEGIMGMATILAVYAMTRNYWAPAILAVNNYMIMLGRVYLREMYLAFFITLSIYFFQKRNCLITAFLIGCGLLIKTSAIVVLPVFLLILLFEKEYKSIFKILLVIFAMYTPVLIYNFSAYITTGYMDATLSRIFGLPHPFLTGSATPAENLNNIFIYLKDVYSLPVLIIFVIAAILNLRSLYFSTLIFAFLFFVFGGPLREYYLLFLTTPLAILTAKLPKLIAVPLIIFSFYYSLSGQSVTRARYEPVRGWPELVKQVKAIYQPNDCLEKSGGVNDLTMRAYFQTDDTPKKVLIGPDYPHYYKMCDEVANPAKTINIFYNSMGLVEYKIL